MKRLRSPERKRRILEVMSGMAQRARHRGDFTADKVALACGISTTLLYRLASPEFRSYRAGLGGEPVDLVVATLRSRLVDAAAENERLRRLELEHRSCPSLADVAAVLDRDEQLHEENRSLRAELDLLRRRQPLGHLRPLDDPV